MARILFPYDGSKPSKRALDYLIRTYAGRDDCEVFLVNIQEPPVSYGDYLSAEMLQQFDTGQREFGESLLAEAAARLDSAGIRNQRHVGIGNIADGIVAHAIERRCDSIVMGTRGMGSFGNLMLGSVATKVIHLADIPVTLVK